VDRDRSRKSNSRSYSEVQFIKNREKNFVEITTGLIAVGNVKSLISRILRNLSRYSAGP
jgi:hypothetical protein